MHFVRTFVASLVLAVANGLCGADRAVITVVNDLAIARPAETIVVPFGEVRRVLGADVPMHHVLVRDAATGQVVPSQVTNFQPNLRPAVYDELVFQHDFAAGEKTARFLLERTKIPVPPYESKVFARYVPERLDDFAWENDRIAHRMYGPALDTPAAGKGQLRTSGIDVWAKRFRYLIVDRWYNKGHDAYHVDSGEGLDTYTVRTGRGCGGTGVWDGQGLAVSKNWASWKVLANGPIRAVFELTYEPWAAGDGLRVSEKKRFTVDAGHNLDLIESTFGVEGPAGEVTIAVGLQNPPDATVEAVVRNEKTAVLGLWQTYPKSGSMGCGVVLASPAKFAGFAVGGCVADAADKDKLTNNLVLARVKNGETLRYAAGAGWDRSGDFPDRASWEAYLAAAAERLASPVKATVAVEAGP